MWASITIRRSSQHRPSDGGGRRWGRSAIPAPGELLISADGGGSNGSRCRLWKVALQDLATRVGLAIHVRHFPPGTSKWNKIEHRMFSHITENWRGRPLVSHEVIINLIARTKTRGGLRIRAELDKAISDRTQSHRRPTQCPEPQTGGISRRLELRDPSATTKIMIKLFSRDS